MKPKHKKQKRMGRMTVVKGSQAQFVKYGSAKKSKSGKAVLFIPSKENKAKGSKSFMVPLSTLNKLMTGQLQYVTLSEMSALPPQGSANPQTPSLDQEEA